MKFAIWVNFVLWGCDINSGGIIWLPHCEWGKPQEYGKWIKSPKQTSAGFIGYTTQCGATIMRSIFLNILTIDTLELACQGEVWGAFYEYWFDLYSAPVITVLCVISHYIWPCYNVIWLYLSPKHDQHCSVNRVTTFITLDHFKNPRILKETIQ